MLFEVRKVIYRLARKLYCWARYEVANRPESNGEYWLIRQVLNDARPPIVFVDIGANLGHWTRTAVCIARELDRPLVVHSFEPQSETRRLLADNTADLPEVILDSRAMSNCSGIARFYSAQSGAGTNSLHPVSGRREEEVVLTTLDEWIAQAGLERVSMIKVDVEGFDSLVLEGGAAMLAGGHVDLVQFEYNWRWLLNGRSLHWVFDFARDKPYLLGKLTRSGIVTFDEWHFELDKFFEGNYVLIRRGGPYISLCRRARFDSSNVLCIDRSSDSSVP